MFGIDSFYWSLWEEIIFFNAQLLYHNADTYVHGLGMRSLVYYFVCSSYHEGITYFVGSSYYEDIISGN